MNLTPNQVVAVRLRLARAARRWGQAEACEQLARFGVHWSVPVLSAAERAVTGKRAREFDADLLVAFSRCYGFPVPWFLCPPPQDAYGLVPEITPRPGRETLTPDELVDALIGDYGAFLYALLEAADLSPQTRARIGRLHTPEPEPPQEEGAT